MWSPSILLTEREDSTSTAATASDDVEHRQEGSPTPSNVTTLPEEDRGPPSVEGGVSDEQHTGDAVTTSSLHQHETPPPSTPPPTGMTSMNHHPPHHQQQVQYCDACNKTCVFMSGRRRKLQVRYEGYVLMKRVPTATSLLRTPYVTTTANGTLFTSGHNVILPYDARRHSCENLLDDESSSSPSSTPGTATSYHLDNPPLGVRAAGILTGGNSFCCSSGCPSHAAPVIVNGAQNNFWRRFEDDAGFQKSGKVKLVNVIADGGGQQVNGLLIGNNAMINQSGSLTSTSLPSVTAAIAVATATSTTLSQKLQPIVSSRREKKTRAHQRLCRKKSRSQENLSGRRRVCSASAGSRSGDIILNNAVVQPPAPLAVSLLSRSEGSIHNVHGMSLSTNATAEGGSGGAGEGAPACGAAMTDMARMKRLLSRVTDEVGQIVFDLEGWNEQYLTLADDAIELRNSVGDPRCSLSLPYSALQEVSMVSGGKTHRHCVRLLTIDTAILLQASNSYTRDQWLQSILWKKNAFKYRNLLRTARRPEVLLKELKNLVEVSLAAPLHDPAVCQLPLDLASSILTSSDAWLSQPMSEEVIVTLAPLLENNTPSPQICNFFSKHCCDAPRSILVIDMFTPVVRRILKHNVDFGKYPHVLRFVQHYIQALNSQNAGETVVHNFVRSLHGPTSTCPHLRVLPNLVSVCTAAINLLMKDIKQDNINAFLDKNTIDSHMACYLSLLELVSEFDDWRPGLAALLQPVPFPEAFLSTASLVGRVVPVIERIGRDPRCEVHLMIASASREKKDGWLQLLCPSSIACVDDGAAWASVLQTLISCCCRRKKFLSSQIDSLGAFMFLALRNNATAQEVLCLLLEWRLIESNDLRLQVVTTLQSTSSGKKFYQELCDRQLHLKELQQKGGPRKLTLPSRSTDDDVIRLLSSGSFGNLQVLSLAFTRVTSECAHQLIKLPDLRYLNLWATQFGDHGLQLISEHLHKLQVLNLCETPVTDLGLASVTALKNLRKLNLNSTNLSADTFQELKLSLPSLQEVDVRYTDAW